MLSKKILFFSLLLASATTSVSYGMKNDQNRHEQQEFQKFLFDAKIDINDFKWDKIPKEVQIPIAQAYANVFQQAAHASFDYLSHGQRMEEMAAKQHMENKAALDRLRETLNFLKDPKNMILIGGTVVGITTLTILSYYAFKLGYRWGESKIGKPTLVRETSRKTLAQEVSEFIASLVYNKKQKDSLTFDDLILPPSLSIQANNIALKAQSAHQKGLPLQHLLLWGPPGTGKTMFARLIALETKKEILNAAGDDAFHLDYAIISGADFAKFGEKGVEEIHKLLDWAESTENGCILFIDEAEAFLRKRSISDARTIRLLDTFLSRTGTSSDKIMCIFATNHPELLDDAVLSRSAEQIYFPLPGQEERGKILKLYIKKYLENDVRTIKQNGEDVEVKLTISKEITPEYLVTVAIKLDNSSGREIEQMVEKIRQSAYLCPEITVTKEIFEQAVKETLEKKTATMNFVQTERMHRARQNPQTLPA